MTQTTIKDLGAIEDSILIFGGPYGNLAATRAMRAHAEHSGFAAEQVICNGDLVAYCGEPGKTVELVQDWGIHVIQGNCEESLAALAPDCGCGFDPGSACAALSQRWYQVCVDNTSSEQRQWMGDLPGAIEFTLGDVRFRLVHGSPVSINEFVFESTDIEHKKAMLKDTNADVIIGGHSGIPFAQDLERGYWLNTGVIGMPANDGTPDGWYLTLENTGDGILCQWHRLEYDSFAIRQKTEAIGMGAYARTLETGLWPSLDILPDAERKQTGVPIKSDEFLIKTAAQTRKTGT